jgi:hypothetical protein
VTSPNFSENSFAMPSDLPLVIAVAGSFAPDPLSAEPAFEAPLIPLAAALIPIKGTNKKQRYITIRG